MRNITMTGMLAGLVAAGAAEAADVTVKAPRLPPAETSWVPHSGFFVGIGGSANTLDFGTQSVYAVGTSNVFTNGVLTSSGSAAGPATLYPDDRAQIAFAAQGGYFSRFSGSDWLWGAKFGYSYLGTSSTIRAALLPQVGSFAPTGTSTVVPFTGNALVQSYQIHIDHQMTFVPFIGHAFDRGFVYLGAGPTLTRVRTDLNGLIGFADLNGNRTDVSGAPINLTSKSWVLGGAAMVGATYFLDPTWFVDVNYMFAMTENNTANYASPFTNPNGTGGTTNQGTMVGTAAARTQTQAITVTINKLF
ncbi:outer membrane protein [Tardiphaga sp. 866_E4_N2_1]|uniref:outer membrane protein n=1 Tax=unclassified Tardiphaga TaxID=2631404 RepID=UPI003F2460C0